MTMKRRCELNPKESTVPAVLGLIVCSVPRVSKWHGTCVEYVKRPTHNSKRERFLVHNTPLMTHDLYSTIFGVGL